MGFFALKNAIAVQKPRENVQIECFAVFDLQKQANTFGLVYLTVCWQCDVSPPDKQQRTEGQVHGGERPSTAVRSR